LGQVVGVISWQLTIPGCQSLKEKRMVVRSLKDRIRHRFNVSVAETGYQDVWTRAELSVALVSGERAFVETVLDKVDRLVTSDGRALVASTRRDVY
jgi:uncharacterized protein YlxP (DUF503 family)